MVLTVLVLTLILTIILLSRHLKKNAGIIYLIYILILFSLRQIQFFSYQSIQYPELAALLNVHILPFSLLIGPCVLYFLKSYHKGQFYIDRYFIIHSIPSFLMLLNISNYLCLPFQLKVNYYLWSQNHIGHEPHLSSSFFFFSPLMKLLPIVVLVYYIIYSGVYLYREYRKESFSRKIKMLQFLSQFVLLAFLNYIPFLVVIGVLIKINGINNTYLFRFPSGFSLDYFNIISLVLPLSFFLFPDFLFGRESKFFSKSTYFNRLLTGNSALEAQSNLTQVDSDFTLIEGYMMSQRPYLSVDFSVQKIAQELQIPRNRISEAFSIKLKKSFPQFRNQLRILYSIEMLKENYHKNYSIEGIAIKSGFKNKSTFYSAFKSETGQTPIDWIKENMS